MKTGLLTALLLLGALAPMTTAMADPVDDAVPIILSLANCFGVGPDGQHDHIYNAWIFTDVLYQRPGNVCA